MSEADSIERLEKQLALLLRRVERLEGGYEELRRHSAPPAMIYPKRRELEALETRIARIEQSESGKP